MRSQTRHLHLIADRTVPHLPVLEFRADAPGPTVLLTANVHGDESTGLAVLHHVADRLRNAPLRKGAIYMMPTLNPGGLASTTRAVPGDGADLNRAFPGRRLGRTSERLAHRIWSEIQSIQPDFAIDVHADASRSIPYVLLDRPTGLRGSASGRMQRRLDELGNDTGLTVVRDYPPELYLRYALDRSLAGALVNHAHIPALTIEAGARRIILPETTNLVANSIMGVLDSQGMSNCSAGAHPTRLTHGPWRRHPGPRAQATGWLDIKALPGETPKAGDVIAMVRATDGSTLERVLAPSDCAILSWVDITWVSPGTVLGTLAVREHD